MCLLAKNYYANNCAKSFVRESLITKKVGNPCTRARLLATTLPWIREEEEENGDDDSGRAPDEEGRSPAVIQYVGRCNVVSLKTSTIIWPSFVILKLYWNLTMKLTIIVYQELWSLNIQEKNQKYFDQLSP